MLEQAEQAVRMAQRTHRGGIGALTVGFVGSAMAGRFSDMLLAFRTRFPDVELTLLELTTSQQFEALRQRRIDVGVLRPFHPIRDERLALETLYEEAFVVALPTTHPLAAKRRIPLRALAHEHVVMVPVHLEPGVEDDIVAFCRRAGCDPQRLPGATQMLTVIGLVAAGVGLSLVPESIGTVRWKGIVYRPIQSCQQPMGRLTVVVGWRVD